jgi:hypothetical protein
MIKMELASSLSSCPTCWIKFIEMLRQETNTTKDDGGFTVRTLNKYLKPYKAVYIDAEDESESHILFKYEEDIVVFKLRFGQ